MKQAIIFFICTLFFFTSVNSSYPGQLDTSFGTNGITVTLPPGFNDFYLNSCVGGGFQSNGDIIAAGFYTDGSTTFQGVAVRYSPDGIFDTTFGTSGGFAFTPNNLFSNVYTCTVQTDDKILIGGNYTPDNTNFSFVLARFLADGSGLDPEFGIDGIVTTTVPGDNSTINTLSFQSDGSIIIGATIGSNFAVARYTSSGDLDPSFGTGGITQTTVGSYPAGTYGMTVNPEDDSIYLVGTAFFAPTAEFAVVKYTPDGTLDSTFGAVTTSFGFDYNATAYACTLQTIDDTTYLLAGGRVIIPFEQPQTFFALARYNATTGALDSSFNPSGATPGTVTTQFQGYDATAYAVAIEPIAQPYIIAAGSVENGPFETVSNTSAIVRYNSSDGSVDNTFGDNNNGQVYTYFGPAFGNAAMYTALFQNNCNLITIGTSSQSFALARYLMDIPTTNFEQDVFTQMNTSLLITLTAQDPCSQLLTFSIFSSPPDNGTLGDITQPTVGALTQYATVLYTPNDGFSGYDTFVFEVNNGVGVAYARVCILVIDTPTASNGTSIVQRNKTQLVPLVGGDPAGALLSFSIVSPPQHGTLRSIIQPNNGATTQKAYVPYKPNTFYTGTDSFTFQTTNGSASSNIATQSLIIRSLCGT